MDKLVFAVIVVGLWIAIGLVTAWWMARRGHRDPGWILMAAFFGPALALAASERIQRRPRMLALTESGSPAPDGVRVLVGVDGSPASEAAVDLAVRLVAQGSGTLTAAEVLDYDAAESAEKVAAAQDRLIATARRVGGRVARCEVLSGPPARALARFSREQGIDVLVIGSHGRGLSKKLLGDVAHGLLHESAVPVLVVSRPAARAASPPAGRSAPGG
ncbi:MULTISPECIES: universal stress protein [unclassified Streptomyces]|uniref:universal stress protein n=1 Tax=unclassified Streptomyces TaxID=2593676 RepID=UPI0022B6BF6C|nr:MULTISPECIES: universal stress protein [unclassified Streptomyces]MCZ7414490.1 universal stress protein [Streptomyces sp. WMMC897]MCZ7431446.1 universal stress protein [Streptomyces sp. WMMC1477]